MIPDKLFFQIPSHVAVTEAAALFNFMATTKPTQTRFLDKRNQLIFDELDSLMKDYRLKFREFIGTHELINHLSECNLLEKAGGIGYVQKVFNSLEPLEDCHEDTY